MLFVDRALVVAEVWFLVVDSPVADQGWFLIVDRTLLQGGFLKCIFHKFYREFYNLDHIFCYQWHFYTLKGILDVEEVQL